MGDLWVWEGCNSTSLLNVLAETCLRVSVDAAAFVGGVGCSFHLIEAQAVVAGVFGLYTGVLVLVVYFA